MTGATAGDLIRRRWRCGLAAALAATAFASVPARADFAGCVAGLRAEAVRKGVPGGVFDDFMKGVRPDPEIIERMQAQPEFKTPIWDYLATLVDDRKVAEGKAMMRRHARALESAQARYGVDKFTIAAVWGVESDFGQAKGKWSLPQSLSTLTCTAPRRRDYFRGELMSTLKIVARGDLSPDQLWGSWAGAFGQTQFMPSTYLRLAVDGDGDGRRDLVDSVADALHSTAHFLRRAGWREGESWGYEVALPRGYSGPSGRSAKSAVSNWAARGVTRLDGSELTGAGAAGLLLPAGRNGPAFLVFKNYDAAFSYNGADAYALAISLLSDRLRGRPGVQGEWPTDDPGLSRDERVELQKLLISRGYDVGEPTGAIGDKTRAAVRDVQSRLGHTATGRPGQKVLRALKNR
jgi:lytic murein transglycosylase